MSGSLLLIAAVWLVLLAPLLLRNQKPVRRTAQALSETRVLHRGGSTLKAKRKLKPAEGLYMSSDDDELELVDAEPEYVLLEDEDSAAGAKSGKPRGLRALMNTKGSERSEDSVDAEVVDGEVVDAEMVDAEVVDAEAADAEAVDAKAKTAEATEQTDANGAGSDAADKGSGRGAEKVSEKVVAAASAGSAVRYTAQDEMDTGEFSPVKKAEMSAESAESSGSSESSDSSDSTEHAEQSEEQSARQGVRNTEDDELGVPDRLIRPGAVILETDEDDPAFSNLEYADGSDFFDVPGGGSDAGAPSASAADEEYLDPRSGIRAV